MSYFNSVTGRWEDPDEHAEHARQRAENERADAKREERLALRLYFHNGANAPLARHPNGTVIFLTPNNRMVLGGKSRRLGTDVWEGA